jgi:preprotein translocase subunit YajC
VATDDTPVCATTHPTTEEHHVPLDFLITPAYAQSAPSGLFGGDLISFLPMVAIFVVFYFLLIRPQQKKAKEARAMLAALQKGDEVVTAGGIVGRISKLGEQYASLEIATGVEMTVQRAAVAQLLPKGTIKNL